jgi:integrase
MGAEYKLTSHRGKWVVEFKDPNTGKRRRISTGATEYHLAERILPNIIKAAEGYTKHSVADLYKLCQQDKKAQGKRAHETMGHYWKALAPHFGNKAPEDITVQHCRDYAVFRAKQGRKQSTFVSELKYLRLALRWAVKHKYLDEAPFIEVPSDPPPRDRHLTKAEFSKLVAAANSPHIRLAIILLLTTAARVEAILQLTWDRVDFDRRKIILKDPLASMMQKGRAVVPINDLLYAELKSAQINRSCDHVIEWRGESLTSIKRGFKRAVERANLNDVSPHVLRHTAAVWMIEAGVPMDEVSQFLGHESINITRKVYARFSPEYLASAAAALDIGTLVPSPNLPY